MPIEQQHPALERIVSPGQAVEELASGFGNDMGPAEGPLARKNFVLTLREIADKVFGLLHGA